MNTGAKLGVVTELKQVYIDTAQECGYAPEPGHFGYLIRVLVADIDEEAQEIGRTFMWTRFHRHKAPREHEAPPGYLSRRASMVFARLPTGSGPLGRGTTYEEEQEIGLIIVGNPDAVIRRLTDLIEHLNPGYILLHG